MGFDREFAMQYVSDNSKVIYNQRLDYQYITSMDNKTLEFYMRLIKSFIRDFPDDFKEI
jgi:hypothetical protein|tara:strand:+ start:1334 stop:1510 length:177 start_codon:yes stop_codon:yes gene_type:complete